MRCDLDLGPWLRSLGLERYEGAFRENEIDERVLPNLTQEDSEGNRRRSSWAPPDTPRSYRCAARRDGPEDGTNCASIRRTANFRTCR